MSATTLTATTISATTYQNLPIDPNYYVTGVTFVDNILTVKQSGQSDITTLIETVTGWTVNGGLSATTFSGVSIDTIDNIDFNTGATTTAQVGRLHWNNADEVGTLELDLLGGNVQLQIGEENLVRVYNADSVTLSVGTVVYVFGSQGNTLSVKRASASGETTSSRTLGVVRESIVVGERGFVSVGGLVHGLDTSSYSGGTPLWLSTTLGQITNIPPEAPNHIVLLGFVSRVSATVGSVFVHISNGWELDELHNVIISGVTNGDILVYDSGTTAWENTKTLNGDYRINGALTATTISATTYQNLPTDVRVTGGTYSSSTGDATFTNNTGGTFNVSGFFKPSDDIYVTGGTYSNGNLTFTNKTGGTFSVLTSTNYAAGVISGATYTSTGTGQINLPAIKVALYNNANNIEPIIVYDVASGTTGSGGIPSLVDQDTNYIVVEYNGGTPRYYVYDNDGVVNDSSVVLFMIVYRLGNFVHTLEFGNQGAGLANKLNDRFIMTDRFGWESGLSLGLSGSTGVVTATEGVAWNASYRQSLTAVNSQDDVFFKNYHSGGVWTYTTTGDTLNNTYYDNGTNIVEATLDKYLVNWYFRGQEVNDHLYEVYGNDEYDSVAEAELSVEPLLPELITSHAFLLGRIIVLKSETTGVTQSAFVRVFQSTQVDNHEDLIGLQGGGPGEYYHLTSLQYNNLPYKNSGNTFTQGQVFTNGVTANTMNISSTPTTNDSPTEVLTRNSTTGQVEITSPQSPGLFNYGLANAIMTGNFLT
jgi:hypothetical protein